MMLSHARRLEGVVASVGTICHELRAAEFVAHNCVTVSTLTKSALCRKKGSQQKC